LPGVWFVHPSPPPRERQPHLLIAPYRRALFRSLDRLGFRFLFVVGKAESGFVDPGVRHWSVLHGRSLGPYRTGFAPALLRTAGRGQYDVWLASILNWWPTHASFPIVEARRKPFVLWTEDWWWPHLPLGENELRRYNQAILRNAAGVIVAGTMARDFAVAGGASEERVFVAYNSTEDLGERPWAEEDRLTVRASLAPNDAEFVCLFMNRLVRYKGLDLLLHAWQTVERNDPGAHLAVVGEGPQRAEAQALTKHLGLTRVRFLPPEPYDRVHLLYRACDVYVHPARFLSNERVKAEAWGFTLNEAMSVGTPVIATTAVAAAADLIEHRATGLSVPADEPEPLAAALLEARDDPHRLAALGTAGMRRVHQAFRPEQQAAAFEAAVAYARDSA
jgi:glycosyltransferase involved in cell wall biosynthesis